MIKQANWDETKDKRVVAPEPIVLMKNNQQQDEAPNNVGARSLGVVHAGYFQILCIRGKQAGSDAMLGWDAYERDHGEPQR